MTAPAYRAGDRVRIADRTPAVHHRVPSYAKGKQGIVERVCGLHGDPEKFIRGDGQPPQRIYRVCISQGDLWSAYDGDARRDTLEIEIFEHWLEPAK